MESGNSFFSEHNEEDFLTEEELTEIDKIDFDKWGVSREEFMEIYEQEKKKFFSLRDSLSIAIRERFGKDAWIVDFSDDEVVFKIDDGEDVGKYKKISFEIKDDNKVELASGDPEEVEKKIQYESQIKNLKQEQSILLERLKKMSKKQIITEEQISKARKEFQTLMKPRNKNLNEGIIMDEKEREMRRFFNEALAWGFVKPGETFEQFSQRMKLAEENLRSDFELTEKVKKIEEKKIEQNLNGQKISENVEYEQAVDSGYMGTIQEYREMKKGYPKKLEERKRMEQAQPVSPQTLIEVSFQRAKKELDNLDEELLRRGQLKRYHQQVERGLFEGSFTEWILLEQRQPTGAKRKELERMYEDAMESGYSGSFDQYLELLRKAK